MFIYFEEKKKKKKATPYDPLCKYTDTTNSLTILVPIGHDDVASHAVSVLKHPIKLSKEALDWCCNCEGGMKGIKYAVQIYFSREMTNKMITYDELKHELK